MTIARLAHTPKQRSQRHWISLWGLMKKCLRKIKEHTSESRLVACCLCGKGSCSNNVPLKISVVHLSYALSFSGGTGLSCLWDLGRKGYFWKIKAQKQEFEWVCVVLPVQVSWWAALQAAQSLVDDSNLTAKELGFIWITHPLQLLQNTLPQA